MVDTSGQLLLQARRAADRADPDGLYDEVLRTVSERARETGGLGKVEMGALVLWKRITAQATWARRLMLTPDSLVRSTTGAAHALANDPTIDIPHAGQAAREALRDLPGMGGTAALASAVLLALAPERMAVWDRRVGMSLSALDLYPGTRTGFYGAYLATTLRLASAMNTAADGRTFVPRDVDIALFSIADDPTMLEKARNVAHQKG